MLPLCAVGVAHCGAFDPSAAEGGRAAPALRTTALSAAATLAAVGDNPLATVRLGANDVLVVVRVAGALHTAPSALHHGGRFDPDGAAAVLHGVLFPGDEVRALGCCAVGTVVRAGSNVRLADPAGTDVRLRVGGAVAALLPGGGACATYCVVPAWRLVPLPELGATPPTSLADRLAAAPALPPPEPMPLPSRRVAAGLLPLTVGLCALRVAVGLPAVGAGAVTGRVLVVDPCGGAAGDPAVWLALAAAVQLGVEHTAVVPTDDDAAFLAQHCGVDAANVVTASNGAALAALAARPFHGAVMPAGAEAGPCHGVLPTLLARVRCGGAVAVVMGSDTVAERCAATLCSAAPTAAARALTVAAPGPSLLWAGADHYGAMAVVAQAAALLWGPLAAPVTDLGLRAASGIPGAAGLERRAEAVWRAPLPRRRRELLDCTVIAVL